MDTRYCSILRTRRKALYLGRPPLRYFTTEEAAFYLRVSKQVIIKAVKVGQLTPLKTETGIHFFYEKKTLLQYAGPSTNPFEIDESSVQTREVVEQQHMSEFSNHLPSNSKSRIFLSEMDIKFEEYKIKKAFNQICEVSLDHRANNLHYYNFTFHPEAAKFCGNKILQEIERYIPPPTKAKPRKKRCKR
jgi:hypothetical protein